jgi:hypothetical protein
MLLFFEFLALSVASASVSFFFFFFLMCAWHEELLQVHQRSLDQQESKNCDTKATNDEGEEPGGGCCDAVVRECCLVEKVDGHQNWVPQVGGEGQTSHDTPNMPLENFTEKVVVSHVEHVHKARNTNTEEKTRECDVHDGLQLSPPGSQVGVEGCRSKDSDTHAREGNDVE